MLFGIINVIEILILQSFFVGDYPCVDHEQCSVLPM